MTVGDVDAAMEHDKGEHRKKEWRCVCPSLLVRRAVCVTTGGLTPWAIGGGPSAADATCHAAVCMHARGATRGRPMSASSPTSPRYLAIGTPLVLSVFFCRREWPFCV